MIWYIEKKLFNLSLLRLGLGFLGLGLCTSSLGAAIAEATITPTATVVARCIVSATDLNFGDYDPTLGHPQDGKNTITVTCTNTSPYRVALNQGLGTEASIAVRKMTNGSNTLNYSLYQDAAHSQLWGNTIGTDTVSGIGTGSPQLLTVYGQILGNQQTAAVGNYADSITVTVIF